MKHFSNPHAVISLLEMVYEGFISFIRGIFCPYEVCGVLLLPAWLL